jgi:hypothetical protein
MASSSSISALAPAAPSIGSSSTPKFHIPKLTKTSYEEWKHHIDSALYLSNCDYYVKNDVKYKDIQGDPGKAFLFATAFTFVDNYIMPEVHQNPDSIDSFLPFTTYQWIVEYFEPKSASSRLHNR